MVEEKVQSLEVSLTQMKSDLEHIRKDIDSIKDELHTINSTFKDLDERYAPKRIEKLMYWFFGTLFTILISVTGFLLKFIIENGLL